MWKPLNDKDTICAVSTPPGVGGISVIRLSGDKSSFYIKQLCTQFPEAAESHRSYFCHLKSVSTKEIVDEVLVSYFAEGKSYTGEESVEISCHGNPLVCLEIIKNLVNLGSRVADKGEFTYRAFMNGKIDLVQAESVLSLIHSQSKKSMEVSLRQLKGELSSKVEKLEDELTYVLAHIEAGIDFTHEDIEINDDGLLGEKIEASYKKMKALAGTYDKGKMLQDGVIVTLFGEANVGKSSLLNRLLNEDKAIVTEIAGTTRDIIEGSLLINGQLVKLIDSAGVRDSEDQVEKIGVDRAFEAAQKSDVVFFVMDLMLETVDFSILDLLKNKKIVFVLNKCDLDEKGVRAKEWTKKITEQGLKGEICVVETVSEKGIFSLIKLLEKEVLGHQLVDDSAVITQSRHFNLLKKGCVSLERATFGLKNKVDLEFIALDLYEALNCLKEILGKKFDDEVMDRVFKDFCIGK